MKINRVFQIVLLISVAILEVGCTVIKPESPWAVNNRCKFTTKVTDVTNANATFIIEKNHSIDKCNKPASFYEKVTYIPNSKIIVRNDILEKLSIKPVLDRTYEIKFGIFYTSKVEPRINEVKIRLIGNHE